MDKIERKNKKGTRQKSLVAIESLPEDQAEVVVTSKKVDSPKTKSYTVTRRFKVGEVWKEKGEKIKLTAEGFRYLKATQKVK